MANECHAPWHWKQKHNIVTTYKTNWVFEYMCANQECSGSDFILIQV